MSRATAEDDWVWAKELSKSEVITVITTSLIPVSRDLLSLSIANLRMCEASSMLMRQGLAEVTS